MLTMQELKQIESYITDDMELKVKIKEMINSLELCNEVLYKFHWDCGRMGDVEGVFKAKKSFVESLIGSEVYFGEILGKHSDVYGTLGKDDLEIISEHPVVVMNTPESGYNPLEYIRVECSVCESECCMDEFMDKEKFICYDCWDEQES